MAKKALINKSNTTPKFKVRAYTRCQKCGRPHSVYRKFHLCRVFRTATGTSLHAYRSQLRLREALGRVPDAADLTALALDLGYASHSHFTQAFRRAFGTTPREWRESASGPRLRMLAARLA